MADAPRPVSETLSWLPECGYYAGQAIHYRVVDGQDATTRELQVPAPVQSALATQDINDLYAPQVKTIEAVRAHTNAVVATPTASGKTLSYVLRALERAIDHHGKTLYIAPYRVLIIFFEEDGQRKRPVVWFDELVITLPFDPEPDDTATAAS